MRMNTICNLGFASIVNVFSCTAVLPRGPRLRYINVAIALFLLSNTVSLGQTNKVTKVEMKALTPIYYDLNNNRIIEEKGIEFFIVGLSEDDVWKIEELFSSHIGIDRARISGNNGHCTIITVQGSGMDEKSIKTMLEPKGLSIEKYSERWINKPVKPKGERVYIQDSPPPSNEGKESKKSKNNKN